MVFILYKLYVLLPYTYPTPKPSPHRRRCISTFPQKNSLCMIYKRLNYGDTENVLINHLLLVIPMSYPCYYTNLCPHKPHKHAHTHTHKHTLSLSLSHTHTHTHTHTHRIRGLTLHLSPRPVVLLTAAHTHTHTHTRAVYVWAVRHRPSS